MDTACCTDGRLYVNSRRAPDITQDTVINTSIMPTQVKTNDSDNVGQGPRNSKDLLSIDR